MALGDKNIITRVGTFRFMPDTYERVWCDNCEKYVKCDMWENVEEHVPGRQWYSIDLCRTCSKKLLKEQEGVN